MTSFLFDMDVFLSFIFLLLQLMHVIDTSVTAIIQLSSGTNVWTKYASQKTILPSNQNHCFIEVSVLIDKRINLTDKLETAVCNQTITTENNKNQGKNIFPPWTKIKINCDKI